MECVHEINWQDKLPDPVKEVMTRSVIDYQKMEGILLDRVSKDTHDIYTKLISLSWELEDEMDGEY